MTNIFLLPALKRHCATSVIGLASVEILCRRGGQGDTVSV